MGENNIYYPFYTDDNSNLSNSLNFSLGDVKQQISNPSTIGVNLGSNNNLQDGSLFDNSNFNFSLNNNGSSLPSWLQSAFTSKDPKTGLVNQGWAGTATDLLKSGLGFYTGLKQLKQAEDTLAENKRQFNLNYDAQKTLVNDELAWQYQARKDRNANNAGTLTQIA